MQYEVKGQEFWDFDLLLPYARYMVHGVIWYMPYAWVVIQMESNVDPLREKKTVIAASIKNSPGDIPTKNST